MREDGRCRDLFGSTIAGFGEETSRGRRRHVAHHKYEKDGKQRIRVLFHIKVPILAHNFLILLSFMQLQSVVQSNRKLLNLKERIRACLYFTSGAIGVLSKLVPAARYLKAGKLGTPLHCTNAITWPVVNFTEFPPLHSCVLSSASAAPGR